jgi:hypothetical protein
MPIIPIIRTRTRYFRHAYPHTRDNMKPINKGLLLKSKTFRIKTGGSYNYHYILKS